MEDFEHAKIGILTGSSFDSQAKMYLPEAERVYLNSISDLILSLKQGKIDGMLMDKGYLATLKWTDEEFDGIEMEMESTKYGIALSDAAEERQLDSQLNEFIHEKTESGWIDELEEKWLADSEPTEITDHSHLSKENGIIRVAATADTKPHTYLKGSQCIGFDIDFLIEFAEEYGYGLEIDIMDFSALLPSLSANRYDVAVYGNSNGGSETLIENVSDSFEKTFIREKGKLRRYILVS